MALLNNGVLPATATEFVSVETGLYRQIIPD
jgi:hypothetical protein